MNYESEFIYIGREEYDRYVELLKGRVFKILPVWEGNSFQGNDESFNDEERLDNYYSYLNTFICNMKGFYNLLRGSDTFPEGKERDLWIDIIANIEGLKYYKEEPSHEELRKVVFKTVSMCKDLMNFKKDKK
jgi:hypothetical protein